MPHFLSFAEANDKNGDLVAGVAFVPKAIYPSTFFAIRICDRGALPARDRKRLHCERVGFHLHEAACLPCWRLSWKLSFCLLRMSGCGEPQPPVLAT